VEVTPRLVLRQLEGLLVLLVPGRRHAGVLLRHYIAPHVPGVAQSVLAGDAAGRARHLAQAVEEPFLLIGLGSDELGLVPLSALVAEEGEREPGLGAVVRVVVVERYHLAHFLAPEIGFLHLMQMGPRGGCSKPHFFCRHFTTSLAWQFWQ